MAAQLNYNYGTPMGVPGGKFDIAFDEVVTRSNEEADKKMKFGLAVAVGTNVGKGVKLPTTGVTADKIAKSLEKSSEEVLKDLAELLG